MRPISCVSIPGLDNDRSVPVTERPFGYGSSLVGAPTVAAPDTLRASVSLAMPVVWSDRHRRHDPGGEVWVGIRTPGTEVAARAERIREALAEAGARFVEAKTQPDDTLHGVHDPELVAYLADAWRNWEAAGLTEDPGQDRVVPYRVPHP